MHVIRPVFRGDAWLKDDFNKGGFDRLGCNRQRADDEAGMAIMVFKVLHRTADALGLNFVGPCFQQGEHIVKSMASIGGLGAIKEPSAGID